MLTRDQWMRMFPILVVAFIALASTLYLQVMVEAPWVNSAFFAIVLAAFASVRVYKPIKIGTAHIALASMMACGGLFEQVFLYSSSLGWTILTFILAALCVAEAFLQRSRYLKSSGPKDVGMAT